MIIIIVQFELLCENSRNNDCIAGIKTQLCEITSCAIKAGAQNETKFPSGSTNNIAKLAHDPGTNRESSLMTRCIK
ncbi:MAG: hypothetical protein ACJ72R_14420 [Nitrososphaeraceae archaeon]|jgi:hypothetical protein